MGMNVSPIRIKSYNNIQFKGNTNPKAILVKQADVIKELNIDNGTSYIAGLMRKPQNVEYKPFWVDLWENLKKNIPIADTVEKLELLKSYGISMLSYSKEETSNFFKFLKSNPKDKDVYFLQTAMDIARKGEIEANEGIKPHSITQDFMPVLDYVLSNKKEKISLYDSKNNIDEHIDIMSKIFYSNKLISEKDSNNIISAINEILSKKPERTSSYSPFVYQTKSILSDERGFLNIGGIARDDGSTEITIGHSYYNNPFYNGKMISPTEKQIFLLLDKDKKLSKLKLFSYSELQDHYKDKDYKYIDDRKYYENKVAYLRHSYTYLNNNDSPFEKILPLWVRVGYNNKKYHLKTIEYDANTKTVNLKYYNKYASEFASEKFKLVDTKSDDLGIMTDENNPISFIPVEPTAYDLEQMINDEKTNNLLKVLDFSGWKKPFMKIIDESLKA